MNFLAILIDLLAIVIGVSFGTIWRGKLSVAYQRVVLVACGLVATVVGLFGIYDSLFVFSEEKFEIDGSMLIVFALVTGTVLGGGFGVSKLFAFLGAHIGKFVAKEEKKEYFRAQRLAQSKKSKDGKKHLYDLPTYDIAPTRFENRHVEGFVVSAMILTFGFLAITAPYQSGARISETPFYIKAGLGAVLSFALSMVYGASVYFAAIPVALCDVITTIFVVTSDLTADTPVWGQTAVICSVIMLAAGLCLAFGKKFKVENMIPAIFIPPIYYGVIDLAMKIAGEG